MMNDFQMYHQQRFWQSMIDLIQTYLNEETKDFYGLVGHHSQKVRNGMRSDFRHMSPSPAYRRNALCKGT
jgi:hypothetical protein